MSRICEICNKQYQKAVTYQWLRATRRNPTADRRQYPNLQKVVYHGKKVKACTRCIKTIHKLPRSRSLKSIKTEVKE